MPPETTANFITTALIIFILQILYMLNIHIMIVVITAIIYLLLYKDIRDFILSQLEKLIKWNVFYVQIK